MFEIDKATKLQAFLLLKKLMKADFYAAMQLVDVISSKGSGMARRCQITPPAVCVGHVASC